jgi:hypothetical protein
MNIKNWGITVLLVTTWLPLQANEVNSFRDIQTEHQESSIDGASTKLAISNFQGQPIWRRPINGIKATSLSSESNITALVVLADNYEAINAIHAPQLCADVYPENTFKGEIVVCQYSDVSVEVIAENLRNAGAGGLILQETKLQNTTSEPFGILPSVAVAFDSYFLLKNWVKYSEPGTAIATIGE